MKPKPDIKGGCETVIYLLLVAGAAALDWLTWPVQNALRLNQPRP